MIIDSSYFVGDIFIPQVGDSASGMANNETKLKRYIDEYEDDFMLKAFGRRMYKTFSQQFNNNGDLNTGADAIWDRLLNGHEYTKSGKTFTWRGLVTETGNLKRSVIAYYVYYHFVTGSIYQHTTLGVIKADAENAQAANPSDVLVNAWRKMIEWYGNLEEYSYYETYRYKGVEVVDYFGSQGESGDVSLYTYLFDHKDEYTEWVFTPLHNINAFGY